MLPVFQGTAVMNRTAAVRTVNTVFRSRGSVTWTMTVGIGRTSADVVRFHGNKQYIQQSTSTQSKTLVGKVMRVYIDNDMLVCRLIKPLFVLLSL